MFEDPQDFISLALAGVVMPDEIDDYVDRWHRSTDSLPLHEYLGMSRDEYALWLSSADTLPLILTARKRRQPLEALASHDLHSMRVAARADDAARITQLEEWLRNRQRVSGAP